MTTILFALAIIAAVGALGLKRLRKARARRAVERGPGSSPEQAIPIRSFDEMDTLLERRRCLCGAFFSLSGEGTREDGHRRLRVARLRCDECEESRELYFDTTSLLQ